MTTTINASTSAGLISSADTSGILQLQTANTAALTINASQNVGIGTASPSQKLHVVGNIRTANCLIEDTSTNVNFGTITAGYLAFLSNGGAEQMRLTSTGLGIGTSSPSQKLTVDGNAVLTSSSADRFLNITAGNTYNGYIQFAEASVDNQWAIGFDGDGSNYANLQFRRRAWGSALTAMTLDSAGNLGLGVTPSASTLATIQSAYGITIGNNEAHTTKNAYYNSGWKYATTTTAARFSVGEGGSDFRFYTAASGTAGNAISFTQAMSLLANGSLCVGTTTQLNGGSLNIYGAANSSPLANFFSNTSGDVGNAILNLGKQDNNTTTSQVFLRCGILSTGAGAGQINMNGANSLAFGTFSDARLKENIVNLPSQLENILALRPVEFDYIQSEGGGHQIGFIAQEMQQIYPDAVGEREDGMLTVSGWSKTEARLIKAIQELNAKFEEYKATHP